MLRLLIFAAALALLAAPGCGDDSSTPTDGGASDSGPAPVCDADLTLETGDATGHADPFGATAGEARAGRLAAGAWPPDPLELSTVATGDFVLANDRVAMVIEDVGDSDGLDPWGGRIVGLARMEAGAPVEPANFNEANLLVERFTVATESVTVMNDGSDGNPAVVRAVGPLLPMPFFDALARTLLPTDLTDIVAAIDWSLAPDADHVTMTYTFTSPRTFPTMVRIPLAFFFQTQRMPQFVPDFGFGSAGGPTPYVAFADENGTSFAWSDPEVDLEPFIELSGATIFQGRRFTIEECAETTHAFADVTIGGRGLDGVLEAVARKDGTALRTITGTVLESDASSAEGVRVHARSAAGVYRSRDLTGSDGTFTLHVPEGEDAELMAWRRGDPVVGPVPVPAATSTADLSMPPPAFIHVVARDATSMEALPVRVQVVPEGDLPSAPEFWGEWEIDSGRLHREFPLDGDITLRVPPGRHVVTVSRGFEYEVVTAVVDAVADATVDVPADLARSVDTTGAMCGDFHIHTHRSMDTADPELLKIASALGDGVEIPVRSDHEWVNDFEPVIAELGMTDWAYGVASLELTTLDWGHFGVFPLDPDPSLPNGNALSWPGRLPPDVFAEARTRTGTHGAAAIIINHPRTFGGLMGEGAYFTRAGYDPTTGMVALPDFWDEQFSLVEVFNDSTFDDNLETVDDWFSFLNAGRRVFAVGSSDSHQIAGSPVGYPRTCVRMGVDTAPELRAMGAGAIRDALVAGRATVSGGVFVDPVGPGGEEPGDTVTGAGARAQITVTVRAASWVVVNELRAYVDGALSETLPVDDTTIDPMDATVRFSDIVEVDVSDGALGSWVVFVATGDADLSPVHPGRLPFAVSNPIFLSR